MKCSSRTKSGKACQAVAIKGTNTCLFHTTRRMKGMVRARVKREAKKEAGKWVVRHAATDAIRWYAKRQ